MITQQHLDVLDKVYGQKDFQDPQVKAVALALIPLNKSKDFYTGMLTAFCVALDLLNATNGNDDTKVFVGALAYQCKLLLDQAE
jgi:hypothetical protein